MTIYVGSSNQMCVSAQYIGLIIHDRIWVKFWGALVTIWRRIAICQMGVFESTYRMRLLHVITGEGSIQMEYPQELSTESCKQL